MTTSFNIFSDPNALNESSEAFSILSKEMQAEGEPKQLTQEGSEYYTDVAKDLYGDFMPQVENTEDVESLEDLSKDRLIEESVQASGERIATGQAQSGAIQLEGITQAIKYNMGGALGEDMARDNAVKAPLENAGQVISKENERVQANWNVINNKINNLTDGSALYSAFVAFIPGNYQWQTTDLLQAFDVESEGFFSQEQNLKRIDDFLQDALMNKSPQEVDKITTTAINRLKDKGYSEIQIRDMLNTSLDPYYTLSAISSAADIGSASRVVSSAGRGVAGLAVQVAEEATPFGVGGLAARRAEKVFTKIKDKTVKSAAEAAEEASKASDTIIRIDRPHDPTTKEGSLEMAGRKEVAGKMSKTKTDAMSDSPERASKILDHQTTDVVKPVKSNISNAADSKFIKTQAALDRATNNIVDMLRNNYGQNLNQIKEELIRDLIQQTARTYDTVTLPNQRTLGDYISAISHDDILTKRGSGDMVFRVRMPDYFETQEAAQDYIKGLSSTGGDLNPRVIKTPAGFQAEVDVKTNKGIGDLMDRGRAKEWRPIGSSVFTHSSNPSDIKQMHLLNEIDKSQLRDLMKSLEEPSKNLSKAEKTEVENLLQISRDDLSWKRPEELAARGYSENVQHAYNTYRIANDIDYFIINRAERQDRVSRGVKQLVYGDQNIGQGAIVRDVTLEKLGNRKIALGSLDAPLQKLDDLDKNSIQKMIDSKEWSVVELTEGPEPGIPARNVYYLLKSDRLVENPLPEFVVPYLPGARRFYDRRSTFIKQHIITDGETGRKAIAGVRTFFADLDEIGTTKLAEKMEGIRKMFARGASDRDITQAIAEAGLPANRIKNAAEFKEFATAMGMDLNNVNNSLEAVRNGRTLKSYDVLTKTDQFEDLVGVEEMSNILNRSSFQAITNEQRMRKLHRSGRELYSLDFNKAQVVDFDRQMQYMVQDMVDNGVLRHFTDYYASRFAKAFGNIMDNANTANSPRDLLLNGTPLRGLTGLDKDKARAAEAAQANYLLVRGTPSKLDQVIADSLSGSFRKMGIAAQKYFHIPDKLAHGFRVNYAQMDKAAPLDFMRAATTHITLGLMDWTQLLKQSASSLVVFTMHPIAATKAAKYAFAMAPMLYKTDGNVEKVLRTLAKRYGDDPNKMVLMAKNMLKMNIIGEAAAGGLVDIAQVSSNKLSRASMAFFRIGELVNRCVAAGTALELNGFGAKALESAKDLARVQSDYQKFFMNMDATGLSRAQSGPVAKLATQMFGWNMRVFEAVFLDREMTSKERAGLILSLLALTGIEGVSGRTNVTNWFIDTITPDDSTLAPYKEELREGFLGMLGREIGVDLTRPFSLNLFDITERLTDIGGLNVPVVSTFKNTADLIQYIARATYEETAPTTYKEYSDLLTTLSSFSIMPKPIKRATNFWSLWTTGAMFNTKGALLTSDNNKLAAVSYLIGFDSYDQKVIERSFKEYQRIMADKKELTKEITRNLSFYFKNDDEVSWRMAKILLQNSQFDEITRGEILKEASKKASEGQYISPVQKNLMRELYSRGVYGTNSTQYLMNKKEKE